MGQVRGHFWTLNAMNTSSVFPRHETFIKKWFIYLSPCAPVVLLMTNAQQWLNAIKNLLRPPHLTSLDLRLSRPIQVIIHWTRPSASVQFGWCGCDNHKALRWRLIIIWKCRLTEKEFVRLNQRLAASVERCTYKSILSFSSACIWYSWYWRIFVLVLMFVEQPSGMSTWLSKTLEMFLGLPPILFNSISVSSGFSRCADNVRLHTGRLALVGHSARSLKEDVAEVGRWWVDWK